MGLFARFRGKRSGGLRGASSSDAEHLINWAAQRRGVEGYLEPRTTVTETTLMLIAHDGEWTRRRVDGPSAAHRLTRKIGIPLYEVSKVGYPQRMRDYQARQRILRDQARRAADG
ncbi:oxidoreductase [Saccharopolyspora pogona]|uniref:oxidoreductase n=1 Tax=Saccharopolyspora pogona TaxID=333966 RepID=UPI001689A736|nr:oxidoreductase [Saccharopolyspora pogona]